MTYKQFFEEGVGWYGAVVILAAFALVSFEVLSPTSLLYQLLNGTGALGVAYISLKEKSWQAGVLNLIWALIAAAAIIRPLI